MITQILRYFYAIKYLKLKQIFYLVYYKFKIIKKINIKSNIDFNDLNVSFLPKNFNPIINYQKGIFEFNNIKSTIERDFSSSSNNKLWVYHLYYFDLLCSNLIQKKEKVKLIVDWINYQHSSKNFEKFEPYPLSLRIVNFIKFAINEKYFERNFIGLIFSDTVYLDKIIEYNIDGNHLLTNAKALIFSAFF